LKLRPIALLGILILIAAAVCMAWRPGIAAADSAATAAVSDCQFHRSNNGWTGSCGAVFGEMPVLSIALAKSITTGIWRQGLQPKAVWAGVLTQVGEPDYPVEIEVYTQGTGVLRTEYGWFSVSGFSTDESRLKFQLDASHEVAPGGLDRAILKRADVLLSSAAVWNRADTLADVHSLFAEALHRILD
jgi:hypothetical protein